MRHASFLPFVALFLVSSAVGCRRGDSLEPAAKSEPGPVPAYTQRPGDPEAGYDTMVNVGFIRCGIPLSVYEQFFDPAPLEMRLPGRTGKNAELPYALTAFTADSGVELVSPNCLSCHATFFEGDLVVGLGNESTDYTDSVATYAQAVGSFVEEGTPEHAEWRKWADRVIAVAPYMQTTTVGVNPANNLTAALFAHRDRDTLAWSNEQLMEPPPRYVLPVSVPPWWRMQKKNSMFYDGGGRGDHARIMMTASALCTDTVEEAREIDAIFPDVRAWIASLEPPTWKHPIDGRLAMTGKRVFEETCARCHGTYGVGGEYPNLVVPLDEVGTDPTIALAATTEADRFIHWFNDSYYGEAAQLAPAAGYAAPPLDGVWATAPYLHNGSIPTISALLDSPTRPRYWTRTFDSGDYDPSALGWNFTELDHGKDGESERAVRIRIYDTTQSGYSNQGHLFGDVLSAEDRSAVLEYLKTL